MVPRERLMEKALEAIHETVLEQANDEFLWDCEDYTREHLEQAMLALRELHDVIESYTIPLFEKTRIQ